MLLRMTDRTGGRYFELPDMQMLPRIFANIDEELRNQYSLGYTPPKGKPGYRKISVSVKRKVLTVQAREGSLRDRLANSSWGGLSSLQPAFSLAS